MKPTFICAKCYKKEILKVKCRFLNDPIDKHCEKCLTERNYLTCDFVRFNPSTQTIEAREEAKP